MDAISQALFSKDAPSISPSERTKDLAQLKEKSDQFESIIIKMMLDNALEETDKGLFGSKDPGDRIYKSMYREELAKASAGSFGFSELLFGYLSEKRD
ncbi:MAG: rod-binding protein [Campylobacterales bacterium]|nr:rod-binding protein [Campylobacterales bacterium]